MEKVALIIGAGDAIGIADSRSLPVAGAAHVHRQGAILGGCARGTEVPSLARSTPKSLVELGGHLLTGSVAGAARCWTRPAHAAFLGHPPAVVAAAIDQMPCSWLKKPFCLKPFLLKSGSVVV